MKKWIYLIITSLALLIIDYFLADELRLHPSFSLMVLFFGIQTFVLFRLDYLIPAEWAVQGTLIKVSLRMLLSMVFIVILIYTQENRVSLAIQFISLYLVYMTFEIVTALTNLRRN